MVKGKSFYVHNGTMETRWNWVIMIYITQESCESVNISLTTSVKYTFNAVNRLRHCGLTLHCFWLQHWEFRKLGNKIKKI